MVEEQIQVEEKKEEVKPVGEEEKTPEGDETVDTALTMGFLTAVCQVLPKEQRQECWRGIEPVHRGERKPLEALVRHFKEVGPEGVKKAKERFDWLIKKAAEEAGIKLEEDGSEGSSGGD
ncbi:MAG: hypothetical protein ACXQTS_06910 [Candidatus Methanospirareceae archaeon]